MRSLLFGVLHGCIETHVDAAWSWRALTDSLVVSTMPPRPPHRGLYRAPAESRPSSALGDLSRLKKAAPALPLLAALGELAGDGS